ncbi:MAG: hypothetical protein ACR2OZ_09710 [Verrucomicrobiales bacterium]
MPDDPVSAFSALEPLFAPHEEPSRHRVKGEAGGPAKIVPHRRPTSIAIAQSLRGLVRRWRATDYPGASDTTRELLHHWFERDHVIQGGDGESIIFRYYFCQREAIETLIYLYEVCCLTSLSTVTAQFLAPPGEDGIPGDAARRAALGIHPDEAATGLSCWARARNIEARTTGGKNGIVPKAHKELA